MRQRLEVGLEDFLWWLQILPGDIEGIRGGSHNIRRKERL